MFRRFPVMNRCESSTIKLPLAQAGCQTRRLGITEGSRQQAVGSEKSFIYCLLPCAFCLLFFPVRNPHSAMLE